MPFQNDNSRLEPQRRTDNPKTTHSPHAAFPSFSLPGPARPFSKSLSCRKGRSPSPPTSSWQVFSRSSAWQDRRRAPLPKAINNRSAAPTPPPPPLMTRRRRLVAVGASWSQPTRRATALALSRQSCRLRSTPPPGAHDRGRPAARRCRPACMWPRRYGWPLTSTCGCHGACRCWPLPLPTPALRATSTGRTRRAWWCSTGLREPAWWAPACWTARRRSLSRATTPERTCCSFARCAGWGVWWSSRGG